MEDLLIVFSFLYIPLTVNAASLVQDANGTWTFLGIKWSDLSCIIIGVLISKLIENASKIKNYKSMIDSYKDSCQRAEEALRERNDEIIYKNNNLSTLFVDKLPAMPVVLLALAL